MKQLIIVLAAILTCTYLHAQTADEIVSKHIEAIGGKTAIESIKTLYIESTVDVMGNESPSTTWVINGKGVRTETMFNGSKVIQCITNKSGWAINPMMGQTTAVAIPNEQLKYMQDQINVGGPLYDYAAKGSKIELTGKDTADYKIKLTASTGLVTTFFINMKTYLIDKIISTVNAQGHKTETTIVFSDYRKIDGGYVMNFGQQVNLPNYSINISHQKVEVNKPIDPNIFDMPK